MLVLALLACENPISNAVLLADEAFATALPGAERLGLPANLRALPLSGDEPLLDEAAAAAAGFEPLLTPLVTAGEVLRSTTPSERGPTHRLYEPLALSSPEGAARPTYWVRATLTRAGDAGAILWTLEGAPTADGPWSTLGSGRHEPDGTGSLTWDLATLDAIVGGIPGDELRITYDDHGIEEGRTVEFTFPPRLDFPLYYAFYADAGFSFTRRMPLADTHPYPTLVTLVVLPDGRGLAEGLWVRDDVEYPFFLCWDTTGDRVHADGALPPMGSSADCPAL